MGCAELCDRGGVTMIGYTDGRHCGYSESRKPQPTDAARPHRPPSFAHLRPEAC
jgi:hypothetical protein